MPAGAIMTQMSDGNQLLTDWILVHALQEEKHAQHCKSGQESLLGECIGLMDTIPNCPLNSHLYTHK